MAFLTTVGELLIDFTPSGKNELGMNLFAQNPGGGVANVAAMFTKLGGQAAFLGKVGKDDFGFFLRKTLEDNGIDCEGLINDPDFLTTLAFVQLDDQGDRSFTFYRKPGADLMLKQEELLYEKILRCQVFHFGAVSLTEDPSRTATFAGAEYAQKAGKLISFDPNYRPFLWPDPREAKKQMRKGASMCHILKVSQEEMELLTEETDLTKGAQKLLSWGPCLVLVSLGAQGAFFYTAKAKGQVPTYQVKAVDTTGAGDAFVGSMLFQLAGMSPEEIQNLSEAQLEEMVSFANGAGSLTTLKKGAIPAMPTLEDIQRCRKETPLFVK